jgi:hypothetical protein
MTSLLNEFSRNWRYRIKLTYYLLVLMHGFDSKIDVEVYFGLIKRILFNKRQI